MAALSFRLRRALNLSSPLLKDRHFSSLPPSPSPPLAPPKPYSPLGGNPSSRPPHFRIQAHSFRSSAALSGRFDQNEKEFGPDEILFEGCDYNHWLITMDFPKDPENAPSRDDMIETYVQTAAKVFGSVEEAKKRIYACSTTTYHGFQCLMDEATSEKFKGLPGVVFILPDSYIDPVNKEYGGDKYENGVITPRPPPVQYGRGRYNDRNRNYDQPRQRRYGDRNMNYDQQGSAPPDGRGFGPPPQDGRGFGPPSQDGRAYGPPPQNGRGNGQPQQDGMGLKPQDGRGYGPPQQDGRGYGQPPLQGGRGYGQPQQDGRGYGPPQQDGRGYGQPPPQDSRGYVQPPQDGRGYGPPPQDGRGYGQPQQDGRGYSQPSQDGRGYGQGQRNFSFQGQGGDYSPGPAADYRQSSGPGFAGEPRQGPGTGFNGDSGRGTESGYAGDYRQGSGFSEGSSSTGPVEGQWQAKH